MHVQMNVVNANRWLYQFVQYVEYYITNRYLEYRFFPLQANLKDATRINDVVSA